MNKRVLLGHSPKLCTKLLKQFKSVFTTDDNRPLPDTNNNMPPIQPIKISAAGVAKLLCDLQPQDWTAYQTQC